MPTNINLAITVSTGPNLAVTLGTSTGSNISALADVTITSVADNDLLQYSSTSGKWENVTQQELKDAFLSIDSLSKAGDYTLAEADIGKHIKVSDNATITLPDGLTEGFNVTIENVGSGKTITLSATTTLNTKDSAVTITSQYGAVSVRHDGSNVWHAWGDLA